MKITAQEEYGLRCLLRLARVREEQYLTIPEVAAAEQLSVPYVAKLLSVLRQAGLVDSERGRTGGYRLAGSPADISLGQVLLVLGDRLFDEPAYCQKHAGTVVSYETPAATGEPYYPVPMPENSRLYQRYQGLAEAETRRNRVWFCGRLAQYRYFNTDEVIQEALQCFQQIQQRFTPGVARTVSSLLTAAR